MAFQRASKCNNYCHYFHISRERMAYVKLPVITTCTDFLIAVSNIFSNSDRMHTYSVLVFIISLHFQIVLNTVGMHYLPSLFWLCAAFKIVSNTVTMLALLKKHCFQNKSTVPTRFKCRRNACVRDHLLFSFCSLQFRIVSNTSERML